MGVKIASTKITQRVDLGTDDFVVGGFGTIGTGSVEGAAIFITTFSDTSAGTRDPQAVLGIGLTDGTNEYAMSTSVRNNRDTSVSKRRQTTDGHVVLRNAPTTGNIRSSATFDSWITDGVRIDTDDLDNAGKYIQAIMFQSDHANAAFSVGSFAGASGDGSSTDVVSLGAEADMVLFVSVREATVDSNLDDAGLSLGIWINDGSDTQYSINFADLNGETTSQLLGFLDSSYSLAEMTDTQVGEGHDISSHASGFTCTTRERNSLSSGQTCAYLAIKWGHKVQQKMGTYIVPDSSAPTTQTGVGFRPEWLIGLQSHLTASDSFIVADSAEAIGVGFYDGVVSHSMSIASEDGEVTTDSDSLHDDEFHSTEAIQANSYQVGAVDNFTDDGWDWTWSSMGVASSGLSVYLALSQLFEATLTPSLPSFGSSILGEVPREGTLSSTLSSLISSISGTNEPEYEGPLASNLPALITSISGTNEPEYEGTLASNLPALITSISGTNEPEYEGSLSTSFPSLIVSFAANAPIGGGVSISLPAFIGDIIGIVPVRGVLGLSLPVIGSSILGEVPRSGLLSTSFSNIESSFAGTFTAGTDSGTLSASLPSLLLSLSSGISFVVPGPIRHRPRFSYDARYSSRFLQEPTIEDRELAQAPIQIPNTVEELLELSTEAAIVSPSISSSLSYPSLPSALAEPSVSVKWRQL